MVLPLVVSAAVSTLALASIPTMPVGGDALTYTRAAQRLVRSGVLAASSAPPSEQVVPNAVITPGYPFFLAGVYCCAGQQDDDAIREMNGIVTAVQFVLVLGIVGCIATCGFLLGGRRTALAAGVLAGLYAPFAFASVVPLSEVLGALLLTLQLTIAVWATEDREGAHKAPKWVLLGLVSGIVALTRPAFALWVALPLVMALIRRPITRQRLMDLAGCVLALALVMTPWWVRNYNVTGAFVPLSTNAGKTTYDATGGDPMSVDEEAVYRAAVEAGEDGYMTVARRRVKNAFRADPVGFVGSNISWAWAVVRPGSSRDPRVGQPWLAPADVYWEYTFNRDRATQSFVPAIPGGSPEHYPAFAQWRDVLPAYQWALYGLAVFGVAVGFRDRRFLLVAGLPLYAVLVHSVTLFINRYFFPVMPAVIVLAGAGAAVMTGWLGRSMGIPGADSRRWMREMPRIERGGACS